MMRHHFASRCARGLFAAAIAMPLAALAATDGAPDV